MHALGDACRHAVIVLSLLTAVGAVLEDKGRRRADIRRARAGLGIGGGACVDCPRVEAGELQAYQLGRQKFQFLARKNLQEPTPSSRTA